MKREELRRHALEYIGAMACELRDMAVAATAPTVAHMFDMAAEEARVQLAEEPPPRHSNKGVRPSPQPQRLVPPDADNLAAAGL